MYVPQLTTEDIDWAARGLAQAWTLLIRYHPATAEEIAATIRVLTHLTALTDQTTAALVRGRGGTIRNRSVPCSGAATRISA
jgi:HEXXH motif-containing protein